MAQAIEEAVCSCPLCGDEISLDLPDWRVPAGWGDVLEHRNKWAEVAREFESRRSLEDAALAVSLSPETARRVLEFLCIEACGCRLTTCVSCLDDYRSAL